MLKQTLRPIIASMVLLGSYAIADNASAPTPAIQSSTKTNQATAEAFELLEIMHAAESFKKTIEQTLVARQRTLPPVLRNDPVKMKQYNRVMRDFIFKYMSWDNIQDDMAKLYTKNYTVSEIRDLKKFYLTPLGQKTLHLMPQISADSVRINNAKLMPHLQELKKKLAKIMKLS